MYIINAVVEKVQHKEENVVVEEEDTYIAVKENIKPKGKCKLALEKFNHAFY